jgi:hypothetical protein
MRRSARRDGLLVERHHDVALEVEPLGHAVAPPARTDRRGGGSAGSQMSLLVAAADLDLVAVPVAGDEPGDRAGHLDHGVVGGGGAVGDRVGALQQAFERKGHAIGDVGGCRPAPPRTGVARRGRMLLDGEPAVVHEHHVGEGPPDVDADAIAAARHVGLANTGCRPSGKEKARSA